MSFCKKCGNEIKDDLQFCPNCGAASGENVSSNSPIIQAQTTASKKRSKWIIAITCMMVATALIAIVLILFGNSKKKNNYNANSYNSYTNETQPSGVEKSKFFAHNYEKPIFTYIEALEKNDYKKYIDAKFTDNMKKQCVEFKFDGDEDSFKEHYKNALSDIIDEDYSWFYGEEFDIKVFSIDAQRNNDSLNLEKYSESISERYGFEVEITDIYTCTLQVFIEGSEEKDNDEYIAVVGKINNNWKVLYLYFNV